ncbi:MAG: NUDIX domain-containing protein [Anaerolineae bacterium]
MSVPKGLKKAAVLCILRSEAGFLLLRRKKEPNLGKYVPVGGHLEPFETPRQAVIREVEEEAGVSIEEPRLRGILTETSPTEYNWIIYIYMADIAATPPVECAEGTLEWVAQERLRTIPIPTTDGYIYDYLSRSEFSVFDAVYDENVRLIRLVDELSGTVLFGG